jgi:HEAT repeat protein
MNSIARWRPLIAVMTCLLTLTMAAPDGHAWQQIPSAKDLSTVIDLLRSPDPVVRTGVACSRHVFDASAAATIPALIDLLNDAEPVAPEVCREDGRSWWGDDRRPITPGQEAARALVRIGAASFDPLVKALAAIRPIARRNAAWALGALDDQRAVQPLIASLKDGEQAVREQTAWALGTLDDARAVQPLIGALRDDSPAVRRQAAWALGAIDDAAAVDALVAALKDSDARVREQSAWALGAIGDTRASAGLGRALVDGEARVRRQAAWALGAIAD